MPSTEGLALALAMSEVDRRRAALRGWTDPADATAEQLTHAFALRLLSPKEALDAVLRRIEAGNPHLNAFTLVDADRAQRDAEASTGRWLKGAPLSPLDGVPTSIKDFLLVPGWPTLRGSHAIGETGPWTAESPACARLREAGLVFVGQTTSSEFAWKATGDSPRYGATRNPWHLGHTSGGSSAGAGAALAAGMAPLALGTDGGGSVRIPASFCGVVGFKPTHGRVPTYPPSPMGTLSNVGPMARSVNDAALMLEIIGRPDRSDPHALGFSTEMGAAGQRRTSLKGLRVGYCSSLGGMAVEQELARNVEAAVGEFERLGAQVDAVEPELPDPRDVFLTLWRAGAAYSLRHLSEDQKRRLDPGLAVDERLGRLVTGADYVAAEVARAEIARRMHVLHEHFDVLVTPAVAVPPLPIGQDLSDGRQQSHWIDWARYSYLFNLTRQPALSLPCGLTAKGLPIGLQIVGPARADALVLEVAGAFELTQPLRRTDRTAWESKI